MTKRISLLIDYPIYEKAKYSGLTFPQIIYDYLKKDKRFNIYSSNDKNIETLDAVVIFSAGGHLSKKSNFALIFDNQNIINIVYSRAKKFIYFFSFFVSLHKIGFYHRHYFGNKVYLNRIKLLQKKYPKIKIIHRLDNSYQFVCKNYGYDKTIKEINKSADLTIHQSKFSIKLWSGKLKNIFNRQEIINSSNSVLINNGVDRNLFNPKGNRFNLAGKWKILHVSASSNPNKGLINVIEMAEIFKRNPAFQFYLIGDQINDPICGSDIKYYENIHYLGKIADRKKIAKYFRSSNIFFYPSINDCSPNVILEALASGLPVITVDSGGNKELVFKEGTNAGCLFNKQNPALSLKTIVENYSYFKKNALKMAKTHYDMNNNLKKYADQICDLF